MGRNDKSFGADLDNGAQLVNSVPDDVFTPRTNVDSRLASPPEPQAGEGGRTERRPKKTSSQPWIGLLGI